MSATEQRKALIRVLEAWRQVKSNIIEAVASPAPAAGEPPAEGNESTQQRPQSTPPR